MDVRTVLVVDDDADIREAVSSVLESAGYATHQVANGSAALEALAAGLKPCAILLDLMMPTLPGEDTFAQLTPEQQQRVIVMTAGTESIAQAPAHLRKPFDVARLLAAVARLYDP